jgi:hypothetical protein
MPSTKKSGRKSRSRRSLNSYQKAVSKNKKKIAALAEKKGIKFMKAAAMLIKKMSSKRSKRSSQKKKRSSKKRLSKSLCKSRGKIYRKAVPGVRRASCAKKSKSKSRSRK